jgi:regulatory protein
MAPDAEALAALRDAWSQVQAMPAEPPAGSSGVAGDSADTAGRSRSGGAASAATAGSSESQGSEADPVAAAREIALRRLSVRARSRKELAQDLKTRDVPAEAAAVVLDRFAEVGLIDDAAFAEQWVESRGHRSGAARLRQELRLKGVAEEHIAEAIAGRDDADLRNARELASRKAASLRGLDLVVRQRRLTAFLGRRGFSNAVIRRVIGEVLDADVSGEDD